MKIQLLVTKPVTVDLNLKIGDSYKNTDPHFNPLSIELGKMELVGQDTDGGWEWKDFFQYKQLDGKGDNYSEVIEIRVINVNSGSRRVTFELVYDEKSSTIAILKFKERY